jgi:putative transposase
VKRAFLATAPNQLWVAEFTYIPTMAGFLHVATVLDVFSRRIVGWSMRETLPAGVVLDALNIAAMQRRATVVVHLLVEGVATTS